MMVGNTTPQDTALDSINRGPVHAELARQLGSTKGATDYQLHLVERQLRVGVQHAHPARMSLPLSRFTHVLCVRTWSQVSRLHADWTVAGVQQVEPLICDTAEDFIRHPRRSTGVTLCKELSVSISISRAKPIPTPIVGWVLRHIPAKRFAYRKTRWTPHSAILQLTQEVR